MLQSFMQLVWSGVLTRMLKERDLTEVTAGLWLLECGFRSASQDNLHDMRRRAETIN